TAHHLMHVDRKPDRVRRRARRVGHQAHDRTRRTRECAARARSLPRPARTTAESGFAERRLELIEHMVRLTVTDGVFELREPVQPEREQRHVAHLAPRSFTVATDGGTARAGLLLGHVRGGGAALRERRVVLTDVDVELTLTLDFRAALHTGRG